MALKKLNPKNLWAVDIDKNAIETAENMGIIDKGYTDAKIPLCKSDIIIVSLYPDLAIKFINENIDNFKRGAVITDTSGIKDKIVENVSSFIPDYLDFIGGHPMAGNEFKGLAYASKDIFKDANYILTPTSKNSASNLKLIKDIALSIGCKNVISIDAKSHDEFVALTSDLTHAIAVSLIKCMNLKNSEKFFIGGSFKDATRVALINSSLWSELFLANKDNLLKQISEFEKNLSALKTAVKNNDAAELEEIFKDACEKRSELNHNE